MHCGAHSERLPTLSVERTSERPAAAEAAPPVSATASSIMRGPASTSRTCTVERAGGCRPRKLSAKTAFASEKLRMSSRSAIAKRRKGVRGRKHRIYAAWASASSQR